MLTKKGRIGYITSYENLLLNFIIKPAEADFQLNRFLRRCFLHKTQVYMMMNGQEIPSLAPEADFGCRRKNCKTLKSRLKDFLKSPDFQDYCNLEANGIHNGSLVWIVRGDFMPEMNGVCGEIFSDFAIVPANYALKPYLYRATKFIHPADAGEKQIGYSQSYVVRRLQNGQWVAECLLENEQWLKGEAVKKAFANIAALREYRLLGGCSVFSVEFNGIKTQAWVSVVSTNGKGRLLLCLLDNGEILDLAVDDVILKKAVVPSVVKTKFNWFKYYDESVLVRN